jgi:hypothetical protein
MFASTNYAAGHSLGLRLCFTFYFEDVGGVAIEFAVDLDDFLDDVFGDFLF